MSNNDAEVDSKIAEGLFPNSTMAYVPEFGTIQNSHYRISSNSANKAAAMVVAKLISVEAQKRIQLYGVMEPF
jgi:putative spermidine/putrescine transport system substrate-binding protein